jgi:alkane 1-monooxygenase
MGGVWTFSAAIAIPLCLTIFDAVLGKDRAPAAAKASPALTMLPRLYIALQLVATAWIAIRIAGGASLLEAIGLTLSNGLTTGVFGLVAAHEMIHDRHRSDRALGLMLLASVLYMHFSISHVRGHHRDAATSADPTTARLGETVYAFIARSVAGQFRDAWRAAPGRMTLFVAVELIIVLAVGLASHRALLFFLTNAALAILLLETFNYVAHYGLRRRPTPDGFVETLNPRHSWNSSNRMNNAALFNMGRHSDHHRDGTRPFQDLEPIDGAPELPSGYAAALLTALVPALWRRVMDPRVRGAMPRI